MGLRDNPCDTFMKWKVKNLISFYLLDYPALSHSPPQQPTASFQVPNSHYSPSPKCSTLQAPRLLPTSFTPPLFPPPQPPACAPAKPPDTSSTALYAPPISDSPDLRVRSRNDKVFILYPHYYRLKLVKCTLCERPLRHYVERICWICWACEHVNENVECTDYNCFECQKCGWRKEAGIRWGFPEKWDFKVV